MLSECQNIAALRRNEVCSHATLRWHSGTLLPTPGRSLLCTSGQHDLGGWRNGMLTFGSTSNGFLFLYIVLDGALIGRGPFGLDVGRLQA